jgi:plasmid stabilization system protein ParE
LDPFQLTEDAIRDIDAIWLYLLDAEGVQAADRIVTELFQGFYGLADIPNRGRRRADLTSRQVLFYKISPTSSSMNPGASHFRLSESFTETERIAHSEATLMSAPQRRDSTPDLSIHL